MALKALVYKMFIETPAFEMLETLNRCRNRLKRFLGCIDRLTANDLAQSLPRLAHLC